MGEGRTPLVFLRHSFWLIDPEILLKVPWAPIYTHFEAERAPKNSATLVNIFQEPKNAPFWSVFFFQQAKIQPEIHFLSKTHSSLENILDQPLYQI